MRPDVILQFGELRIFFALIGLLTVIISILLFLISTRYLVKPITRLSDATKQIAQGNYNLGLPTNRRDEIGQLAGHFMIMSRELERVDQSRQQFVSNVSHEIQTPLTSIQGFAKVLPSVISSKKIVSTIHPLSKKKAATSHCSANNFSCSHHWNKDKRL